MRAGATGATHLQSMSLLKKRDRAARHAPVDICPCRFHIARCTVRQPHGECRQVTPSRACHWARSYAEHFCLHLTSIGDWHSEVEIGGGDY